MLRARLGRVENSSHFCTLNGIAGQAGTANRSNSLILQ
jgi:hypothetical protein